jgi:hypothetical protein
VVYTYPSKKALASIVGRVRVLTSRSAHPALFQPQQVTVSLWGS